MMVRFQEVPHNVSQSPTSFDVAPQPTYAYNGLPSHSRRKTSKRLRASDWEPHKEKIIRLHIDQNLPLTEVRQIMEHDTGFSAELRQYRLCITRWGLDKNVKTTEMEAIVRKRQRRRLVEIDQPPLAFTVRGVKVDTAKIERWMNRRCISSSTLYEPTTREVTPETVTCVATSSSSTITSNLAVESDSGMSHWKWSELWVENRESFQEYAPTAFSEQCRQSGRAMEGPDVGNCMYGIM